MTANEERTARDVRASATQVRNDRATDVTSEGHTTIAPSLAANVDLAGTPVDVVEIECRHLAGAQPETDKQPENRGVTPASGQAEVTGAQEAIDLLRIERSWKPGQTPARDGGHRRSEIL